jgi:hypothetical protein
MVILITFLDSLQKIELGEHIFTDFQGDSIFSNVYF